MQEPNAQFRARSLILTTSLRIPRLHEGLISRPILMGKLDQVLDFPLTLVVAPAGFGKTTLLSQWVSARTHRDLKGRVAWVSLEGEWDARQFWTYIITALQEVQPEIGESALASLDHSQSPIHAVVRTLINEISEMAQDFVLILDDYHHIDDPSVHATLTFFIDHLPSNLHLVIASRSQPPLHFARWRAGNQLYELREEDLRFTEREIDAFFNEIKGLNLLPEEIAALENRTEGWIAGLQLVALSIQSYDDNAKRRFVSAFTGSQRYILDYLIEEVLLQQPDHIRRFLRRTSILDRLSASLCNAVTGQNDGQAILEYLERAHIFTIPLDHEQQWYRYHHLFKDVLYHQLLQLDSDSVLELHRRAAAWHAEAGRTDDAIRHACYAQEWDRAIELIEPEISAAWSRGEIRKIINWLAQLPSSHLDLHPTLSLYYSRALLLGGRMDAAEQRLLESENVLRERLTDEPKAEARLLLGTVCAFRTTIAAVTGETAAAQALGNEALSLLPPDQLDIRAHALTSLGVSYYYSGDMDRATQACSEAVQLAQRVGNLYLAMAAASYQAHTLECKGKIRRAMQILEQALALSKTPGLPTQSLIPAASAICASYGSLLYEWNQLDESEKYLTQAIELGQRLAFGSALWYAFHMLARIKLAQGDQKRAEAMIEQAQMHRLSYTVPLPKRLMDAEQARASLALEQLDFVERWAASLQSDRTDTPGLIQEVEDMTLARFYLLQNRPQAALTLLDRLRLSAESGGRIGHIISALALTAVAHQAQGDTQGGLDTLQTALTMAEPEGYVRTFVDEGPSMAALLYQTLAQDILPEYVRRLLAIFPAEETLSHSTQVQVAATSGPSAETSLIEPLSEREVEVLQLMAGGASNQEIAESLVIAITTAKKHVSNIIRKLGVDNRTQAVAKGRNLGLCD